MSGLFGGLFARSREPSEAEGDEPLVMPSLAGLKREAKIGHGAYGSVYLYSDKRPGGVKQYAVKIIRLDQCDEKIERFQNEVTALKMCKHPNIVRFFFSSIVHDQLWLLMEYIAGGSASHVLRKMGPMPEAVCAVIMHDTLAALHYLNKDGRMHLDIKPGNVLLTLDGRCKLCDFGVARAVSSAAQKPRSLSESQDEATLKEDMKPTPKRIKMAGTLLYMSPEMLLRKANTANTDVWSLGISAIELATGRVPYYDLPRSKATSLIVHYPAPELEGKFTATFKEFVAKCLIKDAAERPAAAQLIEHRFVSGARARGKLEDIVRRCRTKEDDHSSRSSSSQENSVDEEQWRYRAMTDVEWDFRGV